MDNDDFESLKRGMAEAAAFNAGAREGFRVHEPVDIKALRARSGQTAAEFAATYHLPVGTVRDWEYGRRKPDAPARVLLELIAADPERVAKMLAGT